MIPRHTRLPLHAIRWRHAVWQHHFNDDAVPGDLQEPMLDTGDWIDTRPDAGCYAIRAQVPPPAFGGLNQTPRNSRG
jgi:hypothetical protein